jgi:hypothetical protein
MYGTAHEPGKTKPEISAAEGTTLETPYVPGAFDI